jgi:catechol 2,3-dioxygenase-like lactoylglutathione lyase family enzyme/predicted enzyme related to lactoylglutathione lyase
VRSFAALRMTRFALFSLLLIGTAIWLCANAKEKPRPKIIGIVQVEILTTDTTKANDFYYGVMKTLVEAEHASQPCDWCERLPDGGGGPVEFVAVKGPLPKNLISSITFRTDDADGLRKILKKENIQVGKLTKWPDGATFSVLDPENHRIVFVERTYRLPTGSPGAYSAERYPWHPFIHAGFVVRDRAAMDRFYKDILGFRLYWQGGMTDDRVDWVSMQVPDGTDWIEYMLNVPADANQRLRGVMNHIALGVKSVRAADTVLMESRLKLEIGEEPKIGRDGKWQLNLYDPDGTRVELMEFTPVEKPCCAEFTGEHPKP